MRSLNYAQAIREAHAQLLTKDPDVFVIGQGLWSPWYVGTSMQDIDKDFGKERIIDSPVSENGITGVAIGAALAGMRPIVVHPRMDFMLLAVDQIVNQAANWSYMFNGQIGASVVVRGIVNRGGEQGAQHSQGFHSLFAHIPGLKVVMPSTPYDAKGLLIASIYDGNPVIYIDDRWLYSEIGDVPEDMYEVPLGKAEIRKSGKDITLVTFSHMSILGRKAADILKAEGIDVELIDLRTIKPLDEKTIFQSVAKTGRLVVTDAGWLTGGFAAEIVARVAQNCFGSLKSPIFRVALPDTPAPMSKNLEKAYYPNETQICNAIRSVINSKRT